MIHKVRFSPLLPMQIRECGHYESLGLLRVYAKLVVFAVGVG